MIAVGKKRTKKMVSDGDQDSIELTESTSVPVGDAAIEQSSEAPAPVETITKGLPVPEVPNQEEAAKPERRMDVDEILAKEEEEERAEAKKKKEEEKAEAKKKKEEAKAKKAAPKKPETPMPSLGDQDLIEKTVAVEETTMPPQVDLEAVLQSEISQEIEEKPTAKKASRQQKKAEATERAEQVAKSEKLERTEAAESEIKPSDLAFVKDEDAMVAPDLVESIKAQETKPREAWKILFSGLDFAGKSSILSVIRNEFEKLVNPQPTKLTERGAFKFLGQEIAEWDLGGQRLYRIQYLKRPMQYYADTSVLFYVIDVLDEERYDEAIDFLYDTLQLFDKLGINPLISVLFNKFDPEVEKDSKSNRVELKITALQNKINVLAYGRDILFFRTSIFNKFSVIEAFSKSLLQLFPEKNLADYALAELSARTNANIIILLDENRFILGQNIIESENTQYQELVKLAQNTLLSFLYLDENFRFYPFLKSNYIIVQLERYSFLWSQIEESGHRFYVIIFKDGANYSELLGMDIQAVAKTLIKLVKS
jgi:GTPase SAR1 family protein